MRTKGRVCPWDKETQGEFPEVKNEVLNLSKVLHKGTKRLTPPPDASVHPKPSSAWTDLRYYPHGIIQNLASGLEHTLHNI